MFVKCLGSGDAFGSGGRLNTCFYIRTTSRQILLDCGASSLIALKKEGLSANDIDIILITHLHGDHFGGLPFILCEIKAIGRRRKMLTIVGPEGIREKTLMALTCLYPGIEMDDDQPVKFITYREGERLALDDISLIAYKVVHSPESNPHCLRIEHSGAVVTYSGDTEWTDALIPASDGADLFICEATTFNISVRQHLSVKKLMEKLPFIKAKKVVVTHLAEDALKHKDSIPLTVAFDGMVLSD